MGTCPRCLDGQHTWSPAGPERFGATELSRYRCICGTCLGRCDGLEARITSAPPNTNAHRCSPSAPPVDHLPADRRPGERQ